MQKKRFLTPIYLASMLLLLSACSSSSLAEPKQESGDANRYRIKGWEALSLEHRYPWFKENHGNLTELYDEFVGALIDDGLDIRKANWLKPVYGSDNMLWISDVTPGKDRQEKLANSKTQFPPKLYQFFEGDLEVADTAWTYVGYVHNTEKGKMEPFQLAVFTCGDKTQGVSLFYWGGDKVIPAYKVQDALDLLSRLSDKCKK